MGWTCPEARSHGRTKTQACEKGADPANDLLTSIRPSPLRATAPGTQQQGLRDGNCPPDCLADFDGSSKLLCSLCLGLHLFWGRWSKQRSLFWYAGFRSDGLQPAEALLVRVRCRWMAEGSPVASVKLQVLGLWASS